MTELETAISMILDVFAKYSGAEGNKQSLTKGELKTLMEKELPGFLQVRAWPSTEVLAQDRAVGRKVSRPGTSSASAGILGVGTGSQVAKSGGKPGTGVPKR